MSSGASWYCFNRYCLSLSPSLAVSKSKDTRSSARAVDRSLNDRIENGHEHRLFDFFFFFFLNLTELRFKTNDFIAIQSMKFDPLKYNKNCNNNNNNNCQVRTVAESSGYLRDVEGAERSGNVVAVPTVRLDSTRTE